MTVRTEPSPKVAIDLVARIDQLPGEAEWNELLRSSDSDSIFLTWEWVTTWWSIYGSGSRLHVLVARDLEGRLIGIAPVKVAALRIFGFRYDRFEFIGSGGDVTPEYLDFVVRRGYERVVVAAFLGRLMSHTHTAVLDLRPIRPESSVPMALVERQSGKGGTLRLGPDALCPMLPLPTSVEQLRRDQSRNYRKKIGEYQRRCQRDLAVRFRVSATLDEFRRDMRTLVDLHHRRWQGATRAFRTPEYQRFHDVLAERLFAKGHARMLVLENETQPIAALYCFSYGDHYSYYQGGWDPAFARYRPGLVMMDCAIQQAISEHARVFDFLRGVEAYKSRWAKERRACVRATAWTSGSARTASITHDFLNRAIHGAQWALNASGVTRQSDERRA